MSTPHERLHYSSGGSLRKPLFRWHVLQVLGVCTCFVGYRMFDVFPSKVLQYSAVYLIPYYAGMLMVVLPVLFVQLKLGGTTRRNIVDMFSRYTPILKGIAVACIIRIFIFTTYFNVIVAYGAYFTAMSLSERLPWALCNNMWNNETCTNSTSALLTGKGLPEQQYFDNKVLKLSSGIEDEGGVDWSLGVVLLGAWALTFIMVAGGVSMFAWLAAFFGSVSLVMAMALVAYGREELPQEMPGTILYRMDLDQLLRPTAVTAFLKVWLDGALEGVTVTYLWQGILPTVGKYGYQGSRCRRNGMWIILFLFICVIPHLIINLVTVILNPLVAISGIRLETLLESGHRMLFVMMPAAFHHLELGRGVCFVFFFMFTLLLANTQALFSMVAVENVGDWVKSFSSGFCCRHKTSRTLLITAVYCILGIAMGIPQITYGGYYFVQLIYIWADRLLCVVVFLSMICYTEAYAKQPFSLCHRVSMLIWFLLASFFTTAMFVYKAELHLEPRATTTLVRAGEVYVYPGWAYVIGWFIAGGPIFLGLLYGIIHASAQVQGEKHGCLTTCTGQPEDDEGYMMDTKSKRDSQMLEATGNYIKP